MNLVNVLPAAPQYCDTETQTSMAIRSRLGVLDMDVYFFMQCVCLELIGNCGTSSERLIKGSIAIVMHDCKGCFNFCSTFLLEFNDVGDIGFSLILILVVSIGDGHNLKSHFLQLAGIYRHKVLFQKPAKV